MLAAFAKAAIASIFACFDSTKARLWRCAAGELVEMGRPQGGFSCPTCREYHTITDAGQLPVSYRLQNLVEQLAALHVGQPVHVWDEGVDRRRRRFQQICDF